MTGRLEMAHSEVRSLVTKAARGAAMSWGLAEEAGWAADWLARRSMPAAEWATLWLASVLDGRPNPVEVGVSFADRMASADNLSHATPLPDGLAAPGYLLPFLHLVALRCGAVEIIGTAGRAALVGADGSVVFGPAWSQHSAGWSVQPATTGTAPKRLAVAASVIDCLEGLALNTAVPPSETSRRDAGSATPDND